MMPCKLQGKLARAKEMQFINDHDLFDHETGSG